MTGLFLAGLALGAVGASIVHIALGSAAEDREDQSW
jgi:hypothetical protein